MPDVPVKLSDMTEALTFSTTDLLYLGMADAGSDTGYYSRKIPASTLASAMLGNFSLPLLFTNTDAKTVAGAVNEAAGVKLSGTLLAGNTSITLSDASITASSMIDVYTDTGIGYESITASTGSVTITFEAQASDMGVKVVIK